MTTSTRTAPSREGVVQVFDRIAPTYDFLNRLLSFRRDVAWRRRLVAALPADRPVALLDLATGTGDVLMAAQRRLAAPSRLVGVDASAGMLAQAGLKLDRLRRRHAECGRQSPVELRQGDATGLDFDRDTFDAVTIAFGIRNVVDTPAALAEMRRVLKPGGRALILEFSLPANACVRGLYLFFFRHILPRVGGVVSGDAGAYAYLNRSVETYPYGPAFVRLLEESGFVACACTPLTFGIASLYSGQKPS